MKTERNITYYINGVKTTKNDIAKRKDKKLSSTIVTTSKYYTAPLNKEEKAKRNQDAINSSNYFDKLREQREDLEARHG